MKYDKHIKYLLIFAIGALSVIGYNQVVAFLSIDNCLDKGGRWNHELNECEYIRNKVSINPKIAYEIEINNIPLTTFIKQYISEVASELTWSYVIVLNVGRINDGRKYSIHLATHEIYADMGEFNYEDKVTDHLEPEFLYSIVEGQIVLIKSGIEKLTDNMDRFEYILELTSHKIKSSFKTREPDNEGFYELNAPPTQHFDYWIIYECDNNYNLYKMNAWGEVLNGKQMPNQSFCNHMGDSDNPPEPLKPPNENYQ